MQSQSIETTPFEFLPQGQYLVDIPEIEQALSLSQSIAQPIRWQSYLALLALSGFTEWLETYGTATGLTFDCDRSQARLIIPSHPDQPAAISQLYLNQFRLCLIPTTGSPDDMIELPSAIVEQPKQLAQFYITVNINPEAQVASLQGFLRHDQLQNYRTQQKITPHNGIYSIPTEQFEPRIDRLLFLASHLNLEAIPLPQSSLSVTIAPIKQLLIQPIVNTGNWLQQQVTLENWNQRLDQISQSLDQVLLLPNDFRELIPAVPFRGDNDGFRGPDTTVLQAITQQGYNIPVDVRVNYQNLSLDGQSFRLTFVTWQLSGDDAPPGEEPEWSLLIIAQLLDMVTQPIRISVQQMGNVMATEKLESLEHYQIFQAIGFLQEQFTLEIATAQSELVLPPLKFEA
ncbi:MAG: DUF1822 family protein [Alkalinema sp. RU_4_3]|nr:DUF1822 family protein [Alkalinema sp. RU_4_3]